MIKFSPDILPKVEEVSKNQVQEVQVKELAFSKIDGSYYAEVPGIWNTPSWQATLMVSSFPVLLDYLWWRQNGDYAPLNTRITIKVSNDWFEGCDIYLQKEKTEFTEYEGEGYGGDYIVFLIGNNKINKPFPGWLCSVNSILWGGIHPSKIYAQVL